jgi:hypothetical protein
MGATALEFIAGRNIPPKGWIDAESSPLRGEVKNT